MLSVRVILTTTKAILFFVGCSEVNSTWLITSELANQRARKVLFTRVVYTKTSHYSTKIIHLGVGDSGGYFTSPLSPLFTSTSVNNC